MIEPEKNIIFPVSPLHIQLNTNLRTNTTTDVKDESKDLTKNESDKAILFKRSMLKMPKMNISPVLTSEFPFFTRNVRYPESIQTLEWRKRYEFFFNKELFISKLKQEAIDNPRNFLKRVETEKDQEWIIKTEKHNVMVTLRALFPIPEAFGKALDNSYDMLIKKTNNRVIRDINIRSAMNIFGFMYKFGIANKEMEEYFVNIDGKRYMVDNIIWENDLLNHPIYRSFLKSQRETYEKVENSIFEVNDKFKIIIEKLNSDLQNMLDKDYIQTDFFLYSKATSPRDSPRFKQDMLDMIIGLKNSDTDINKLIEDDKGNILPNIKYLIHKHYFKKTYKLAKEMVDDGYDGNEADKQRALALIEIYERMDSIIDKDVYGYEPFITETENINNIWTQEIDAVNVFDNLENYTPEKDEIYLKKIKDTLITDLKTDTIQILRENIIEKNKTGYSSYTSPRYSSSHSYPYSTNIERKATVGLVTDKLNKLSKEPRETDENIVIAANIIIAIKDDFDSYLRTRRSEDINVFMDREYIILFERILRLAIEIKATRMVLNFATKNIPMNLSDKNPDGTDILPVNKSINNFIRDYFRDIATINDELIKSLNNIYEPTRKTSNEQLYKVLRLFKLGDIRMKMEYKSTNSELDEYKKVFQTIYDKYISISNNSSDDTIIKYMYTGVDEVIEELTKRNVKQIYVYIDLVDADAFENTPNASCKLFDKELEQEFKYLADPRNKQNYILTRFRDYIFVSDETKPNKNKNEPAKNKTTRRNMQKHNSTVRKN